MSLFDRLSKALKPVQVLEEGLGEEHAVNFDSIIQQIQPLTAKAQVTFLYKLVGVLPLKVVRTMSSYLYKRLGYDKNPYSRPKQHNADRKEESDRELKS